MYNLNYKFKFFACFYLFMTTERKKKLLFPKFIYKVKRKKNKNLGDIKCVEVKRVFCKKKTKKKNTLKKKEIKVVILSAQLLNLYQKGLGVGVGTNYGISFKTGKRCWT